MALVTHNYSSWDAVPLEAMSDIISRRVFSGEKAMVAQVYLKKDAVVPLHHHESEQITYIMDGALKFELEGREVTVRKGELLLIPSNVPHRAVALEDTLDLDIFAPIRVDWLQKDDGYLRRGEVETSLEPDGEEDARIGSPS
jgi:quercetin dioxygenase-like cupin family protein